MHTKRAACSNRADGKQTSMWSASSSGACTHPSRLVAATCDPCSSSTAARKPVRSSRHAQRVPPMRVIVPARTEVVSTAPAAAVSLPTTDLLSGIVAPVKHDMEQLTQNLKDVVGNRHPMLRAAADQIFGAGGKRLRPVIVFLVARATAELMHLRCARVAQYHC